MTLPARRARMAVLLIVLGVTTNLAVAWGCSALASHMQGTLRIDEILEMPPSRQEGSSYLTCRTYSTALRQSPGVCMYTWTILGRSSPGIERPGTKTLDDPLIPAWSLIHDPATRDECEKSTSRLPTVEWYAGWPMLSMHGRLTSASFMLVNERTSCHNGMLRFKDNVARIQTGTSLSLSGHLFPLIPVWLGLIINSVLYALVWTFLLVGVGRLRVRRRRRRGLCPACTYDLRATPPSSPCPECGRAAFSS